MVNINKKVTKVCSFYASDWHLITMLLPHVNKAINEKSKITTILENDTQEKVKELLAKLRLKNEKKILNIDWNKKDASVYEVEKILRKRGERKLEIIISGCIEYIEEVNSLIEDYVNENKTNRDIKIINCYSIEQKANIKEILKNHQAILNTAGEISIDDYIARVSN